MTASGQMPNVVGRSNPNPHTRSADWAAEGASPPTRLGGLLYRAHQGSTFMPRNSTETRLRAKARLEKASRMARTIEVAVTEREKEQQEALDRTAKLKAARLARDAAEGEAARATKPPKT